MKTKDFTLTTTCQITIKRHAIQMKNQISLILILKLIKLHPHLLEDPMTLCKWSTRYLTFIVNSNVETLIYMKKNRSTAYHKRISRRLVQVNMRIFVRFNLHKAKIKTTKFRLATSTWPKHPELNQTMTWCLSTMNLNSVQTMVWKAHSQE